MKREVICITATAILIIALIVAAGAVGSFEQGLLTVGQFLVRGGTATFAYWVSTCLFDYASFL